MKVCFSLALAAAAVAVLATDARAQPRAEKMSNPIQPMSERAPVLVGPVLGLNRNFHTGGFRTITHDEACPVFAEGSGWGFLAGLTAEIMVAEGAAVIPRVIYESRPGLFESRLPDALVLMPGSTEVVNQTVTASSDVTYTLVTAEALYKHEVTSLGGARIALAAGPSFGLVTRDHNRQVQDLVTPTNAVFTNPEGHELENGGRRIVFYDEGIADRTAFRFSLKAGVQAEVGLFGGTWYMTPGLYYDYGLSDVTRADNWQLNTVMFMVDFRRGF
jgi:hypothetical protein